MVCSEVVVRVKLRLQHQRGVNLRCSRTPPLDGVQTSSCMILKMSRVGCSGAARTGISPGARRRGHRGAPWPRYQRRESAQPHPLPLDLRPLTTNHNQQHTHNTYTNYVDPQLQGHGRADWSLHQRRVGARARRAARDGQPSYRGGARQGTLYGSSSWLFPGI